METVKTYRVVRGELLVGRSIRIPGDLVPEAKNWTSLRSYLSNGNIEIAYVDVNVLNDFKKKIILEEAKSIKEESKPVLKKRVIRKKVENARVKLSEQSV